MKNSIDYGFGVVVFYGNPYTLLEDAYFCDDSNGKYFKARARYGNDLYNVSWTPTKIWLETNDGDDGDACIWDNPEEVVLFECGEFTGKYRDEEEKMIREKEQAELEERFEKIALARIEDEYRHFLLCYHSTRKARQENPSGGFEEGLCGRDLGNWHYKTFESLNTWWIQMNTDRQQMLTTIGRDKADHKFFRGR